ncbi:MAG: HEAT repeat domain-containing protein [Anaerolineales bacterium]|nr:HEAT repeat domain-containing protein [Chloroflexota bacterium]MBL6979986.1 HEAT repeat domain-containing protein [Anaerolineales bacterium]
MRKQLFSVFLILFVALALTSCKNPVKLCDKLQNNDKDVQLDGLDTLKRYKENDFENLQDDERESLFDCVFFALGDTDEEVRQKTFETLKNLIIDNELKHSVGVDQFSTAITATFGDENKYNDTVRGFAIDLIAFFGKDASKAISPIIQTMGKDGLNEKSINALKKIIVDESIPEGIAKIETALADELAKLPDDKQEELPEKINLNTINGAAKIIEYLGPKATNTVDALITILGESRFSFELRNQAASSLGSIGEAARDAIDLLIETMGMNELHKKSTDALKEIINGNNITEGVNKLESVINTEFKKLPEDPQAKLPKELNINIVDGVLQIIGNVGSKGSQIAIETILVLEEARFSYGIRNQAAVTLGDFGETAKEAIDPLIQTMGEEQLHEKSTKALEKIIVGDNIPEGLAKIEITLNTELAKLPKDKTENLPDELNIFIVVGATQIISGIELKTVQATDELILILETLAFGDDLRNQAAFALGNIGEAAADAIDPLILTLGEDDLHDNSLEALKSILIGKNITAKNIKKLEVELKNNVDVGGAINILEDSENTAWKLREMAAKVLMDIGTGESFELDALISAFGDPNISVQSAAEKTLQSYIQDEGSYASDQTIEALVNALTDETAKTRSARLIKSISPNLFIALDKAVSTLINTYLNGNDESKNIMTDKTLNTKYQNAIIDGLLEEFSKNETDNYDFNMDNKAPNEDEIIEVFTSMTGVTDKLLKIFKNEVAGEIYENKYREAAAWVLARTGKEGTKVINEFKNILHETAFPETITEALGLFVLSDNENEAKEALVALLAMFDASSFDADEFDPSENSSSHLWDWSVWDAEVILIRDDIYTKNHEFLTKIVSDGDLSPGVRSAAVFVIGENAIFYRGDAESEVYLKGRKTLLDTLSVQINEGTDEWMIPRTAAVELGVMYYYPSPVSFEPETCELIDKLIIILENQLVQVDKLDESVNWVLKLITNINENYPEEWRQWYEDPETGSGCELEIGNE